MKRILIFIVMFFVSMINVGASELPKLYLTGDISNMYNKEDVRNISVNYVSDDINFTSYAKLKIQGTSSTFYNKKNYNITFYDDSSYNSKYKVDFGWGEQSKYCLKANWIDKTHSRNLVTASIASDINKEYNLFLDTPNYGSVDGYPIEVYINNEFLGLYTLNIPKDAWLYNLDEDNPNHIAIFGTAITGSVLFREESIKNGEWEIEVGEDTDAINQKIKELISFVSTTSDDEFKENISNYFNLDSLLNYYVVCEYADLYDNTFRNFMMVTYDGKIWNAVLYDLDTAWGVTWYGNDLRENYNMRPNLEQNLLFKRLKENFSEELADRYFELRKKFLNKDYVMNKFTNFKESIPEEIFVLENLKWDNIPGYDITQIEDFIDERTPVLDAYFNSFYKSNNNILIFIFFIIFMLVIGCFIINKHNKRLSK